MRAPSWLPPFLVVAVGCGSATPAAPPPAAPPPAASPVIVSDAAPEPPPTSPPPPPPTKVEYRPVDTNPQPGVGKDFIADGLLIYRVFACGGDGPLPTHLDKPTVDAHCKRLRPIMQRYRDGYLEKASAFFAQVRPETLPPTVVYPFGGGDLLSALTTFPDAQELTTISLEYAGDPQRVATLIRKRDLEKALKLFDDSMTTLLAGDWAWTRNFEAMEKLGIPDQLSAAMVALVVHGFQPVSIRFFTLDVDGNVDYLDQAKLDAAKKHKLAKLRSWGAPDWSSAFANVEIRFRPVVGEGPVRVFRHIAANLSNAHVTTDAKHLTKDMSVLAHLQAKGPVSALTRAASHLMWESSFSSIRDYLTANLVWMPSDSTGIPPPFAQAAGLVQDTYGAFEGAYEPSNASHRTQYNDAFIELFKRNPQASLDFRYGYPDVKKRPHMIITRRVK